MLVDQNGTVFGWNSIQWPEGSTYGLIEFSLREQETSKNLTIKLDLGELHGVKGNWQLEIPIDLTKSKALTTIVSLKDMNTSEHGVAVNMKEVRFASSSTDLFYETGFTNEEQEKIGRNIQLLAEKYGEGNVPTYAYGSDLQYHIENDKKEAVYHYNSLLGDEESLGNSGLLQGSGQSLDQMGHTAWNHSFIPQKEGSQLTFVLDGVFKTVPADFSVTFNPRKLKRNPVSFEYEGNSMTIKNAKKQSDYYLRKSILPIGKRTTFTIEMEGESEANSSHLGDWVLVDGKGNSYDTIGAETPANIQLRCMGWMKFQKN